MYQITEKEIAPLITPHTQNRIMNILDALIATEAKDKGDTSTFLQNDMEEDFEPFTPTLDTSVKETLRVYHRQSVEHDMNDSYTTLKKSSDNYSLPSILKTNRNEYLTKNSITSNRINDNNIMRLTGKLSFKTTQSKSNKTTNKDITSVYIKPEQHPIIMQSNDDVESQNSHRWERKEVDRKKRVMVLAQKLSAQKTADALLKNQKGNLRTKFFLPNNNLDKLATDTEGKLLHKRKINLDTFPCPLYQNGLNFNLDKQLIKGNNILSGVTDKLRERS
jgi:hypothetical protein